MDGVTDFPFRSIQKEYGQPRLIFTEFTSVEGVCHGAHKLLNDFLYDESQRPIIGQIYGITPDFFRQTSILLCHLGFDGIDINMGCPAKNVAHSGAGATLITTPIIAQKIIAAVQTGIAQWQNGANPCDCPNVSSEIAKDIEDRHQLLPLAYQGRGRQIPVSIKTRVGYDKPVIENWIPRLLETGISAISLHGRTLKQHYSGQASWELIGQAANLTAQTSTLLLGNGDVVSYQDAVQKAKDYHVNGVLIGRASMGNPYVFLEKLPAEPTLFKLALEHAQLFEQTYANQNGYSFLPMRKHLGWYVKSIPHASEIRIKLFQTNSATEVKQIFQKYGLVE